MRKHRPTPQPRKAFLLALGMLTACHQAHQDGTPAREAGSTSAAAPTIDENQAQAFHAGRDLIGKHAPDLSFPTIDGRTISLGERRAGRPIYLKFWATWCATCRQQMDAFKTDFAQYAKDIDFVAVNTGVNDDRAAVDAYRRIVQLPMPIAIDDGRLGDAFHLKVTPQHVIIGRDGVIRYVGHLEDERLHRELKAAIDDQRTNAPQAAISLSRVTASRPAYSHATYTSVQGGTVRFDGAAHGAQRLLYFLSPWCETYLRESRPAVARECKDTRDALTRAGVGGAEVIGIASGLSTDPDGVRRFIKRTGFAAPIVMDDDGQLFRRFGVRNFPTVIQLDSAGRPSGRLSIPELDALSHRPTA